MRKAIFVDTGFWLALFNKRDERHDLARQSIEGFKSNKLVITDFIVYETITFLNASVKNHQLAMIFLEFIEDLDNIKVFDVDKHLKEAAMEIFKKYSDKNFSFTDCVSFAVMDKFNIYEVFTFDDHFKQMGYTIK
jgi:hypothetical protein